MDNSAHIIEKAGRPDIGSAWVVVICPATSNILLGKRSKTANNAGQWNLFGGGIEVGETAIETALRELSEEAGIDVSASEVRLLGTSKNMTIYVLSRTVEQAKELIRLNKLEVEKTKWFTIGNLPANLHKSAKGLVDVIGQRLSRITPAAEPASAPDKSVADKDASGAAPTMRQMMDVVGVAA